MILICMETNLDKCRAVINMEAPTTKKEVMKLNWMLTILDRFISRLAQHALIFYKLMKNNFFLMDPGMWTWICVTKNDIISPLVLSRLVSEEIVFLYLVVSTEAFNVVLILETSHNQSLIYLCIYIFVTGPK